MRSSSHLVPWLGHLLAGLALFVGGLEVARIFWPGPSSGSWEVTIGGGIAALMGLAVIVKAEIREKPLRLLRKARRALVFPTQWAVKYDKSVPQGGVIPVAVIRSDGVRFVIDIQGYPEVDWNEDPKAQPLLVGPRGKRYKPDPTGPLMQAANAWGANAVLWLPDARCTRNLRREGTNLLVVMGPASELKNALRGAEIARMYRDSLPIDVAAQPKRRKVRDESAPLSRPQAMA